MSAATAAIEQDGATDRLGAEQVGDVARLAPSARLRSRSTGSGWGCRSQVVPSRGVIGRRPDFPAHHGHGQRCCEPSPILSGVSELRGLVPGSWSRGPRTTFGAGSGVRARPWGKHEREAGRVVLRGCRQAPYRDDNGWTEFFLDTTEPRAQSWPPPAPGPCSSRSATRKRRGPEAGRRRGIFRSRRQPRP